MIESWHSLLAERDVTVGNSQQSEWEGELRAGMWSDATQLYTRVREGV